MFSAVLESAAPAAPRAAEPGAESHVSVGVSPSFRGVEALQQAGTSRGTEPARALAPSTQMAAAPPRGAPPLMEIPEIDDLVTRAIRAGRTPGAVVVVGRQSG